MTRLHVTIVRIAAWSVCWLAPAAAGCRHETIEPLPGVQPTTGLLLKRQVVPLGPVLRLERYGLLGTDISNDFYPFNISRAKASGPLVSKLFARCGGSWQKVDFVEMPLAETGRAANLFPDARRIIYDGPDVTGGEGDWPRSYSRNRRTRRLTIYHADTGGRFVLDCYTELYGLSHASYWRADGESLAATLTCEKQTPGFRGLFVLNSVGKILLDATTMTELAGLEFIANGPDGKIAALRPNDPGTGGATGGVLVEVDPGKRTAEEIAGIPGDLASRHVGRMDEMIQWTDGHLELTK